MQRRSSSTSSPASLRAALDVYLLPAVVGGGLGDIAEVLDAGHALAHDGHTLWLYRANGRPVPASVDGPWSWPARVRRTSSLRPAHARALTVAATWGVSAAPEGPGPLGRAGPWGDEAAAIEATYGRTNTLHVSLEEFARGYSAHREFIERHREGGAPLRNVRSAPSRAEEIDAWRRAFRRHRALDRPNVLHLLAGFAATEPIAREHSEIVVCGPLWPPRPTARPPPARTGRRVVWYASPVSSDAIAPAIVAGLADVPGPIDLLVRAPRPVPVPSVPGVRVEQSGALAPDRWAERFQGADLRIVTGSRTLLEAIALGRPFLYFNGILRPRSGRVRRHRPEKIQALLRRWVDLGVRADLRRDLDAFSRGARVRTIVARAITDPLWRGSFPSRARFARGLPTDAATVLRRVAGTWAAGGRSATEVVAAARAGADSKV